MSGDTSFLSFEELAKEFILQIIIGIVLLALGAIFNKQLRRMVKRASLYIGDKQIKITATSIVKFDSAWSDEFDNSIFNDIKTRIRTDDISKNTVSGRFMKIYSNNLGMFVIIRIEEEPNLTSLEDQQVEVLSYNIVIKMEAEIRGVKQIDSIQDFVHISDKAIEIIKNRCFASIDPRSMYIVCDVKDALDETKNQKIEDSKLGASISFHETTITIVSRDPQHLARTIKKYVYRLPLSAESSTI